MVPTELEGTWVSFRLKVVVVGSVVTLGNPPNRFLLNEMVASIVFGLQAV